MDTQNSRPAVVGRNVCIRVSARLGARIYRTAQVHPALRLAGALQPQPDAAMPGGRYLHPQVRLQVKKNLWRARQQPGVSIGLQPQQCPVPPIPTESPQRLLEPEMEPPSNRREPHPNGHSDGSPKRCPSSQDKPGDQHHRPQQTQREQQSRQNPAAAQGVQHGRSMAGLSAHGSQTGQQPAPRLQAGIRRA